MSLQIDYPSPPMKQFCPPTPKNLSLKPEFNQGPGSNYQFIGIYSKRHSRDEISKRQAVGN